ncbi:sister-chromatid cohesion protein 3 [Tanacetum coccineum]
MNRSLFTRIVRDLSANCPYFQEGCDAVGKAGISALVKCTSAIRQLAYAAVPDSLDEYLQIGEKTSRDCLMHFCNGVIELYGEEYLRRPTQTDVEKLYAFHENKHGFPVKQYHESMEEEPEITEQNILRSKRPKAFDGQPTRIRDGFESDDDFVAELEPKRRKVNLSHAADGAKEAAAAASLSSENLIEVIKGSGKQIPQVVKLWVEQYEKDSKPAMVELLTMLFEACGAKFSIQGDLLDETNTDDVVVALVNMAAQGTTEDFQSSKKKEFRSFKENLVSFWDNLVSECQNGPLFDQVLFDKCMHYVIALSSTPTRVYRQVASLVGLQMVTSFIGVAKMLGDQRQTMQTQLTAEKKKTSDGPNIELLNKRLSETHEKMTMIEEMMRKIFTRLFVHRCRDIDPDIRMSCIQSLGAWIVLYPSLFLQDLYLKYLGWALDDKSAGVTKASILALQDVYDVDDNVPSLGLFTERFYKRMLDLADDNDISVAVCAISLVKQLLRHQLVPDDDLGSSTLAKLRALRTSREENRRQAWENPRI